MSDIKNILKDIVKSLFIGLIISLAITIVVSLVSLVFYGFNIIAVINSLRAALFIFGALLLFISAYILMFKKEMLVNYKDDYKKAFKMLQFEFVLLIISLAILFIGIAIDYTSYMF